MSCRVIYRFDVGQPWKAHTCALSGRADFDAYHACWLARNYVRQGGASEAIVLQETVQFARFTRSATGDLVQEGGLDL